MDFTQDNIQQMKKMYLEDVNSTYTSIAKSFGTTRKVIARILKENGVKPKEPVKAIQAENSITSESKEKVKVIPETNHYRIVNFIGQNIPDATQQFRDKSRKSEIYYIGLPKGIMTNNCAYDPILNGVYFLKSYHDIISWFREYIQKAIKAGYEDELHLLEIYMDGKRIYPKYELHVLLNLDENAKEEIVFEHNRISTLN